MINENELSQILLINNNNNFKNNKTFFGSSLKKFINKIYYKFEIPKESFIISLYYLYNFYNCIKNNKFLISNFFDNINIHIFTCIIISLKQIYDENLNIKYICNLLNINFNNFTKYEIIILKTLNWNVSYLNNDFVLFKNSVEHYMDL
jgi:hypothetical protein